MSKFSSFEKEKRVKAMLSIDDHAPGSEGYKEIYNKLILPALVYHQRYNSHHPEYFTDGVDGMTLLDVVEMFCNWRANSDDMFLTLKEKQVKYQMTKQLHNILINTYTFDN